MTLRQLNRATLARQMLLAREKMAVAAAVARLLGLQAQLPRPPFAGLWSRVEGFTRGDLLRALEARTVVRATSMRGTIHLMTAADFIAFRGCLQPGLDAGMLSLLKERARQLDAPALVAAARAYLSRSHTFEEVRDHLVAKFPGGDERAMGYAVRMGLPVVQVPGGGPWGFPAQADFVSAAAWLGRPVAACRSLEPLVRRYLAAYGPATVRDAQAWLGLAGLEPVFEKLSRVLDVWKGPAGRTWYDLPESPRPDPETPAPVRFLPEWDSAVVTRADERIVARADRPRVFLPGLRVASLVLVDGFAAGAWKVSATARKATMTIETFSRWPAATRREVEIEAHALLRFAEPQAEAFEVKVVAG
jgi:Winged helix DNA-binding domain